MIARALTAVATGEGHRQCFKALNHANRWREFFVGAAALPTAHRVARLRQDIARRREASP
jgi:hypothetical protein